MRDFEKTGLPVGWVNARLGNIADKITKGATPTTYGYSFQKSGINFIKIQNVSEGSIDLSSITDFISDDANQNQKKSILKPDDVLFSIAGTIGETAIVKSIHLPANTNQAFAIISGFKDCLLPKFLGFQLRSFVTQKTKGKARGGAMNNVSLEDLKELEIPLPPLPEQHRIVAKIEELFSELDKGIESLKTAREQLKVYRQALLKHAFEGKLTERWREENKDVDLVGAKQGSSASPAFGLRSKHGKDQNQGEAGEAFASPLHEHGRGQLKRRKDLPPLTAEELAELPELPLGWGWVKYGDLCSKVRNGISEKPVGESGALIFRISAVRPMFFDMNDYRFIDNSSGRFDDNFLARGDLVFTRYNGSRHYVGVCARYNSDERRLFPDKLIQTRVDYSHADTSYLEKALNCGESRRSVESKIRTTAGQSGVSGSDIKNIPVPLCSLKEQLEILNIIDDKLSATDQLDQTITTALQQSETLRQSILKKAFSGQLVPQDPHDEPASVLLERIRVEKSGRVTDRAPTRSSRSKATP
jgi:type I restriction enzyme S subunit